MRSIEERFGRTFAPWGIALPPGDAQARRRGKIVGGGWAIWYLFGFDERGGYLDYYASHRMTDDRHVRLREDGPAEALPTIRTFRIVVSRDPGEDARLEAEHLGHNRQVGRLLEEKGFGVAGDEPLSVRINRHLRLGGDKERELNVFFDVQGTLMTMEEVPRPRAREAFLALKEEGHELYLWSSGGAGYAATAADLLGVADLVSGCFDKREEPDVPVDFAVDDDASVVEAHGGYRIKPFDGDPSDEELLRAAEAVDGASGRGATP